MEGFEYVEYNGTTFGYDTDYFNYDGGNVSDISSEKEVVARSSGDVDYSDYFTDIIGSFQTLVGYDENTDTQLSLVDIHNDLKLIMLLIVCFFLTFVGHAFVNRFRNL